MAEIRNRIVCLFKRTEFTKEESAMGKVTVIPPGTHKGPWMGTGRGVLVPYVPSSTKTAEADKADEETKVDLVRIKVTLPPTRA